MAEVFDAASSVQPTSGGQTGCRWVRLRPVKLRSAKCKCVQIEQVMFRANGKQVIPQSCTNPGGDNPLREGPENTILDKRGKWLDKNVQPLIFEFESPVLLDAYCWKTANDASSRDMVQWVLEGSDDSHSWHVIHDQNVDFPTPEGRFEILPMIELKGMQATGPSQSSSSQQVPARPSSPQKIQSHTKDTNDISGEETKTLQNGGAATDTAVHNTETPSTVAAAGRSVSPTKTKKKRTSKITTDAASVGQVNGASEKEMSPTKSTSKAEAAPTDARAAVLNAGGEEEMLPQAAIDALPEDAPEGHAAWNIRWSNGPVEKGGQRSQFFIGVKGSGYNFQTTRQACSNSRYAAERIARACFMKGSDENCPKEAVAEFRKECYDRFKTAMAEGGATAVKVSSGTAASDAKPKAAKGTGAKRKTVEGETKPRKRAKSDKKIQLELFQELKGGMRVKGRTTDKKNSSINGVYQKLEELTDGMPAYKQIGTDMPRFLFFAAKKQRWKISDELGDSKKGFAYVAVEDDGSSGPYGRKVTGSWIVFDGKENGYNADGAVVCSLIENEAPAEDGDKISGASSNSSSSSSESEQEDAAEKATDAAANIQKPPPRGMVCAKMMARAKWRTYTVPVS